MASKNRGSAPTPSHPHARGDKNQRQTTRTRVRSEAFRDLCDYAASQGILERIRTGVSTSDALQLCLDRAVAIWTFCVQQADEHAIEVTSITHPDGTTHEEPSGFFVDAPTPADPHRILPNKWIAYEREARKDIEELAGSMTKLGIAERQVRVQEAQVALVAAAVREAAIEAGLTPDQVRALGSTLRSRLTAPDARADLPPDPSLPAHVKGDYPSGRPPGGASSLSSKPPGAPGAPPSTPPRGAHASPQARPSLPSASRSQDADTARKASSRGEQKKP